MREKQKPQQNEDTVREVKFIPIPKMRIIYYLSIFLYFFFRSEGNLIVWCGGAWSALFVHLALSGKGNDAGNDFATPDL